MSEIAKSYSPSDIEQRCYERWEANGYFKPSGKGDPYCIMIPPPNVTGTLHMGHAFQDTIMDALTRYHRMRNNNTLWQMGTDHAGIATQMVIERQLNAEGKTRQEIGRDKFVERVWQWTALSGSQISQQLRRMGASVDWSRDRFTMDEGLSRAVLEVFVALFDEGLIYRGKRLVNWDTVLHTALSDLEVLSAEENGHLWHFRYPLVGESGGLVVATTRPETMLGDTAVAVNPEDKRYREYIGREVELPLTGRKIPVIADEYVDPEFGTGCVKITPAHDFNDFEIGERHGLPAINILTEDATLNENAPAAYRGMDRFAARDKVVEDMQRAGLLEKTEDHKLMVPRGDRSGTVVEPYLTDQWYVNARELAQPAIEAVQQGRIRFVPANWSKTYFEWMNNIQDWCISRQLWWGHRIPAWYDADDNIYVARSEDEARKKYELGRDLPLRQDEDVLDTWFSSALWPFSTLGWPDKTRELKTFYPTSVLITGFDIIFFWVARMIMMGLKFMNDVPFREVYIHGLIKDHDGQKMSKSKGNVLDPLDLIDGIDLESLVRKRTADLMQPDMAPSIGAKTRNQFPEGIAAYGTDSLRFTFASLATTGRDIRFDLGRIEGYRNFCNKIWNASRYVLINVRAETPVSTNQPELGLPERWIRSRLSHATKQVLLHFRDYRFDLAAQTLYEFTWHEFCDWYIELSKPTLQSENSTAHERAGTRLTLASTLEKLLRLLHPLMPFITEELWQRIGPLTGKDATTIMLQDYPEPVDSDRDTDAETEIQWIMDFVLGIRQIRGEMDISPAKAVPVLLKDAGPSELTRLDKHRSYLMQLARLSSVEVLGGSSDVPQSATALLGDMKILVPMAGLVNVAAERERLTRRLGKRRTEAERAQRKLANENFVNNAPAPVVEKERSRAEELRREIRQLEEQLAQIELLNR